MKKDVVNYLLGYENLKIIQNPDMFNFSLDSVLLANFVTLNKKIQKVLDIGTGNAPIPLIVSTRTSALIEAVEIQKDLYAIAEETVIINNLQNRINIINADIMELYKNIESDTVDVITCNPPFFKISENSKLNDSDYKKIARHEIHLDIERLFLVAKKLLKNNGNIAIVHRPERLSEIITTMKNNNIEPKRILFIYPKVGEEANTILIEGTKNGKPGLKILPPLIAHDDQGEYSEEIKRYFS